MKRKVKNIEHGMKTTDGAGVHLRRVFGYHQVPLYDPYLLLDFFDSTDPNDYTAGFPWHPHRGIETITFLYDGKIEHGDSLGNSGVIGAGDCQWMTAGSGIVHQEMPKASDLMLGIQLWANLPASLKMTDPHYMDVSMDGIPKHMKEGVSVRIFAGEYEGLTGPVVRSDIEASFLDVEIDAGAVFAEPVSQHHTVFALLVRGSAHFESEGDIINQPGSCILFGNGDSIEITAGDSGAHFLLVSGKPIGEPVAWGGPIVMNTDDELETAFSEYRNGTFIK